MPGIARAQSSSTLDEAAFWTFLQETETVLMQAEGQTDTTAIRMALLEVWHNVRQVRLIEKNVEIDLTWLRRPLEDGDADALVRLQRHIRALLDYRARMATGGEGGASLSTLDQVLRDSRFLYDDMTPTPIATPVALDFADPPAISPDMSQLIIIVGGIAALVLVIWYLARTMQVQPNALTNADAQADDPKTASSATDRASAFAANGNYRSAIRYLYLSSLLWLDERGLLRYDASLTNREHLRQVRDQHELHDRLRKVVNTFEDVWYGDHPVDESYYLRYVQQIEELRLVTP
jgi:hypothetical protein